MFFSQYLRLNLHVFESVHSLVYFVTWECDCACSNFIIQLIFALYLSSMERHMTKNSTYEKTFNLTEFNLTSNQFNKAKTTQPTFINIVRPDIEECMLNSTRILLLHFSISAEWYRRMQFELFSPCGIVSKSSWILFACKLNCFQSGWRFFSQVKFLAILRSILPLL